MKITPVRPVIKSPKPGPRKPRPEKPKPSKELVKVLGDLIETAKNVIDLIGVEERQQVLDLIKLGEEFLK